MTLHASKREPGGQGVPWEGALLAALLESDWVAVLLPLIHSPECWVVVLGLVVQGCSPASEAQTLVWGTDYTVDSCGKSPEGWAWGCESKPRAPYLDGMGWAGGAWARAGSRPDPVHCTSCGRTYRMDSGSGECSAEVSGR